MLWVSVAIVKSGAWVVYTENRGFGLMILEAGESQSSVLPPSWVCHNWWRAVQGGIVMHEDEPLLF